MHIKLTEDENPASRAFASSLRIFKVHQIWPKDTETNIFLFKCKAFSVLILFSLFPIGCMSHLIHIVTGSEKLIGADLIEDISLVTSGTGLLINIIIFILNHEKVAKLLKDMTDFRHFGHPEALNHIQRGMLVYMYGLYIYCCGGILLYSSFGIFQKSSCEKIALENNVEKVCGLLGNTYVPFIDLSGFPNRFIYLIVQTSSAILIYTIGPLIAGFSSSMIEVFHVKVDQFNQVFMATFEIIDVKKRRLHFRKCIQYHIDIIALCDQINDTFGMLYLSYLVFSSVIISIFAFGFMLYYDLKALMHGFGWVIGAFILCNSGQRMLNLGMSIPKNIYDSNWYLGDTIMQRDMMLILARSQRFLHLNARGFGIMSFATFKAILSTAYSYLALLYSRT